MTSKAAESAERNIHSLHYKLMGMTKPLMIKRGLTPPRFRVLMQVMRNQPANMSALNLPLHITGSTLTSLVDGLVRDGLVERYRGDEDRRKVFLKMTERGTNLLEELHARARKLLGDALTCLEENECETLLQSIDKINKRLEEIMIEEKIE